MDGTDGRQLGRGAGDPRGVRYSDRDKDAAYELWRTAGGRSIRRVAVMLGIAERTIRNWHDDHAWSARADTDDADDLPAIVHGARAIIAAELIPSILTVKAIRDGDRVDPKIRLAAAQWLAGLAGYSPINRTQTAAVQVEAPAPAPALTDGELVGLSPDQLMAIEQQYHARRSPS